MDRYLLLARVQTLRDAGSSSATLLECVEGAVVSRIQDLRGGISGGAPGARL